jgi:hypothetical protein
VEPVSLHSLPVVFVALSCVSLSWACGGPSAPLHTPDHWSKEKAYGGGSDPYASKVEEMPARSPSAPTLAARVSRSTRDERRSAAVRANSPIEPLLQNEQCLTELRGRSIRFMSLDTLKGVENPVEIRGDLGGVQFWANDGRPLQMDCRLAIALDDMGRVMKSLNVTRIRYSGSYVYRTTRTGRLSHHALGLAIDLHDFEMDSHLLSVKSDFRKNAGCKNPEPGLNFLACQMREQVRFEEFLTPDFNADHRDHLHISVHRRKSN